MEVVILMKKHLIEYVCPNNRRCKFEGIYYDKSNKRIKSLVKHTFHVNKEVNLAVENIIQSKSINVV